MAAGIHLTSDLLTADRSTNGIGMEALQDGLQSGGGYEEVFLYPVLSLSVRKRGDGGWI